MMRIRVAALVATAAALAAGPSRAEDVPAFGFPFGFSVEKMDRTADPRTDFARYASGRWIDAARIPGDNVRISPLDQMSLRVEGQIRAILEDASRTSTSAPRGSPRQQVGDHFAAGLDVDRIEAVGISPLAAEFARIDAIDGPQGLAAALARLVLLLNDPVLAGVGVATDPADRTRYTVFAMEPALTVPSNDVYLATEMAAVREGLLQFITAALVLTGVPPDEATVQAHKIVEIETRVARKKLSPVDMADPAKLYTRMSYAQLQSLAPAIDWTTHLAQLGLAPPAELVVTNREALSERSRLLGELPLADLKSTFAGSCCVESFPTCRKRSSRRISHSPA